MTDTHACFCVGPPGDCPCIRRGESTPNRRRTDSPQWPVAKHCSVCNIRIDGVMGYVCSNDNCPIFPRVTSETKMPTV